MAIQSPLNRRQNDALAQPTRNVTSGNGRRGTRSMFSYSFHASSRLRLLSEIFQLSALSRVMASKFNEVSLILQFTVYECSRLQSHRVSIISLGSTAKSAKAPYDSAILTTFFSVLMVVVPLDSSFAAYSDRKRHNSLRCLCVVVVTIMFS